MFFLTVKLENNICSKDKNNNFCQSGKTFLQFQKIQIYLFLLNNYKIHLFSAKK